MKALPEHNLISEVCDQKHFDFQILREPKNQILVAADYEHVKVFQDWI